MSSGTGQKKVRKRDMQASARTLAYFLQTRAGRPTTVQQASRHLKMSPSRVTNFASRFQKEGKITRLSRGVYASLPGQAPPPPPDGDQELLDILLKEREQLDAQIEKVRAVMELKKKRVAK